MNKRMALAFLFAVLLYALAWWQCPKLIFSGPAQTFPAPALDHP